MATKSEILDYVDWYKKQYEVLEEPIYEIYLIHNPDKELYNNQGLPTGFPDNGYEETIGFYYDIDIAIIALRENWLDINEFGSYNAAFILCKFPGLDNAAGEWARMFFIWDDTAHGFVECDEPAIHHHMAY